MNNEEEINEIFGIAEEEPPVMDAVLNKILEDANKEYLYNTLTKSEISNTTDTVSKIFNNIIKGVKL